MGETLIKTVIDSTGLPSDPIAEELNRLIEKAGLQKESLTLDDMRTILADYLQDTLLDLKKTYQSPIS